MERKTYRINEVVEITGLGRSTIYKLIDEGELRRIKNRSKHFDPRGRR